MDQRTSNFNALTVDRFVNPTVATLERIQSLAFKHAVCQPTTLGEVRRESERLNVFTEDIAVLLRGAYADGNNDTVRWLRKMSLLQLWRFYRNGRKHRG